MDVQPHVCFEQPPGFYMAFKEIQGFLWNQVSARFYEGRRDPRFRSRAQLVAFVDASSIWYTARRRAQENGSKDTAWEPLLLEGIINDRYRMDQLHISRLREMLH